MLAERDRREQRLGLVEAASLETELYTMNPDGTGMKRLTTGVRNVEDPAWSPDGRQIASSRWDSYDYEEDHSEDQDIWVVGRDGPGLRNVIRDPDEGSVDKQDHDPIWSPDGRYIAFLSERDEPMDGTHRPDTSQVWRVRADGTGLTRSSATDSGKTGPLQWLALPFLRDAVPPVCEDGSASTEAGKPVRVPLTCVDDNGDGLTLSVVGRPAHGDVSVPDAGGAVRYTPAAGWTGTDTFTFKASDGSAESNTARRVERPGPALDLPRQSGHRHVLRRERLPGGRRQLHGPAPSAAVNFGAHA